VWGEPAGKSTSRPRSGWPSCRFNLPVELKAEVGHLRMQPRVGLGPARPLSAEFNHSRPETWAKAGAVELGD